MTAFDDLFAFGTSRRGECGCDTTHGKAKYLKTAAGFAFLRIHNSGWNGCRRRPIKSKSQHAATIQKVGETSGRCPDVTDCLIRTANLGACANYAPLNLIPTRCTMKSYVGIMHHKALLPTYYYPVCA